MNINLSKQEMTQALNIHLEKVGYTDGVEAKVCIVMDGSGSMTGMYRNGTVQGLVNRALVIGDRFDDDGTINVFDFSDGDDHRQLPDATQNDFGTYMEDKCMIGGGTDYSPVIKRVEEFFYKGEKGSKGFLGFGKKAPTAPEGRDGNGDNFPVYCIFITDGETWHEGEDKKVIQKILNKRKDMFIQFVGIGNSSFKFLRTMASSIDNCGFADVTDFNNTTEEELLRKLLPMEAKDILTQGAK